MTDKKIEKIKYLYHGTTEKVARKALTEGLKTRESTGSKGNWEHTIDSPEDRVYLTNAYAGYFAMCATEEPHEPWGIIEVDVSKIDDMLFPDEDFLEQATRNQDLPEWEDDEDDPVGADVGDPHYGLRIANEAPEKERMKVRTEWYKDHIFGYRHYWEDSIEHLGNCCHLGDIPPEAITRVTIFNPKSNLDIAHSVDPCITLMNYRICGEKYREITKWLAGYDVDPEALCGLFFPGVKIPVKALSKEQLDALPENIRQGEIDHSRMGQQMIDAVEHWKANVIPKRDGLEVLLP